MSHSLSRRAVLRYGLFGSAGLLMAACQPKTVEKIVKETVIVKEEVSKEVEKEVTTVVEKEVQVEVEKVVTATPAPKGTVPILFWFTAENHKPEYATRVDELNEKFNIDFTWEVMSRDAQNKKFPATLMSGSGYPDIIECNAGDVTKYLKGDDKGIAFLALNDVLDSSPYYPQVLESRWDRFSKDGLRYAAPHDVHPLVMLYHDVGWKKLGVDLAEVVTWDDFLAACQEVPETMDDGRPRYALMDCLSCSNLPARMLQKGIWWTDPSGEPMLTSPEFREAAEDWMRFRPHWVDRDSAVQVSMHKDEQNLTCLTPDWMYGIYKQGTLDDAAFLADSPFRVMRIPDFVPDGPHSGTWGGTGCSVPKVVKEPALSTEIMLYLYFENGDCQLEKRYKDTGILPPVTTAWDECAGFHDPDPMTGGQIAADVFIASAKDLPGYSENWKTALVSTIWAEQFPLAWEGAITLDEAIAEADTQSRDLIEKNA